MVNFWLLSPFLSAGTTSMASCLVYGVLKTELKASFIPGRNSTSWALSLDSMFFLCLQQRYRGIEVRNVVIILPHTPMFHHFLQNNILVDFSHGKYIFQTMKCFKKRKESFGLLQLYERMPKRSNVLKGIFILAHGWRGSSSIMTGKAWWHSQWRECIEETPQNIGGQVRIEYNIQSSTSSSLVSPSEDSTAFKITTSLRASTWASGKYSSFKLQSWLLGCSEYSRSPERRYFLNPSMWKAKADGALWVQVSLACKKKKWVPGHSRLT